MRLALERIRKQATESRFFDSVTTYTEADIPRDYFFKVLGMLHPTSQRNSVKWYMWKPYFIQRHLSKIPEGDIVIFLDAGCHINSAGKTKFNYYLQMLANGCGIMAVQIDAKHPEYVWTKKDVFDYFGVTNNTMYTHSPQICAGHVFLKKNSTAVKFINEWVTTIFENITLYDDTPSKNENFMGFIETRWEQSIFSILCKIYNVSTLPISDFESNDWDNLKETPIHDRRDRGKNIRLRYYIYKILSAFTWGRFRTKCRRKVEWFEDSYGFYLLKGERL